jgi:hypothetical protein
MFAALLLMVMVGTSALKISLVLLEPVSKLFEEDNEAGKQAGQSRGNCGRGTPIE